MTSSIEARIWGSHGTWTVPSTMHLVFNVIYYAFTDCFLSRIRRICFFASLGRSR